MKVFVSALIIGLAFIISPAGAIASDPPVVLTHKVTGSVIGLNSTDLAISGHVANFLVSRSPLFWAGTCLNTQGIRHEFPVMSDPGGIL